MSKQFEKIKGYYIDGFWNETRVRNMAKKGIITEEECNLIILGKSSVSVDSEE